MLEYLSHFKEVFHALKEMWMIVLPALSVAARQYWLWRKKRKESFGVLSNLMEEMQVKWVQGVKKNIDMMTEMQRLKNMNIEEQGKLKAELHFLKLQMEEMREHCPNCCYNKIMKKK